MGDVITHLTIAHHPSHHPSPFALPSPITHEHRPSTMALPSPITNHPSQFPDDPLRLNPGSAANGGRERRFAGAPAQTGGALEIARDAGAARAGPRMRFEAPAF
jgi:hypothetical protein